MISSFRNWMEMSSLRDLLSVVPQSPKWHKEGDVFTHTRLVRKSLEDAIRLYFENKFLSDILGSVSEDDKRLLKIASWLHDIGKAGATKYIQKDQEISLDKFKHLNVKQMMSPDFGVEDGKWQSLKHEEPEFYEPEIQKLSKNWSSIINSLSAEDKDILWFIIKNHMSLGRDGVNKDLVKELVDEKGNVNSSRRIKLLIIFKLMDAMGREGEGKDPEFILTSMEDAIKYKLNNIDIQRKRQGPEEREEFTQWLYNKGLPKDKVDIILKNKFGE